MLVLIATRTTSAYIHRTWEDLSEAEKARFPRVGDTCLTTIIEWGHTLSHEDDEKADVNTKGSICNCSENFGLIDTEIMCSRPSDDDSHGPTYISLRPATFSPAIAKEQLSIRPT